MNCLVLLAALTAGHCDGTSCAVTVHPVVCESGGCETAVKGRPVRRAFKGARAVVERRPARAFARRLFGRLARRGCR
jgi:hypothetical protein